MPKNQEFEIIIGIGVIAALLSFVFENEDIFNYGIKYFFIHWFNFYWDEELLKKER